MCLLYAHPAVPTLMLMCTPEQDDAVRRLLREVAPALPERVHVMASAHLDDLGPGYMLGPKKRFHRMMLERSFPEIDTSAIRPLGRASLEPVLAFYDAHYPGNWFDPRMLDTGCYFGAFVGGELACVAGVHVFSEEQRVAALGNIATAHQHRGHGLATRATSALLQHLRGRVDHVGLNVATDNTGAIALYRRLGFEIATDYFEASAATGDTRAITG
jgi:ribosomal protein S18 acetylase RimI-like enzyme